MTAFKCKKFISHNNVNYDVGASIELTDDDEIARLEKLKAIESLDVVEEKTVDAIEELKKVDGVTETIAKALIDQGIDSIEKLGVMEENELSNVDGITKKIAKKIYKAFVSKD